MGSDLYVWPEPCPICVSLVARVHILTLAVCVGKRGVEAGAATYSFDREVLRAWAWPQCVCLDISSIEVAGFWHQTHVGAVKAVNLGCRTHMNWHGRFV